ncbi:MAG: protein-glutamate O-methyltransferase CheR [Lachnospiraceae bacterium]|nr:protein-glutamate O-methyltransferase CheR [Lachnospiraceae bacterium]
MEDNYELFKKDVFQLTKIDLNAYKERQMKRRIDALIAKHKITTYKDYVKALKENKELFDEFVNYLTINVSEFYRNPELWKVLEKDIMPVIFEKTKTLKIWSAACSTGDEPYSLVMMLNQFLPLTQIHIIATDIDKQVLDKARMGLYNDKSLKGLPDGFIKKYFTQVNEHNYQINADIKRCVEFKEHNLLKDPYPAACDLIVCRNVLIYFTEEAKVEIYKKFNDSLKPEGFLFVGSTEQIIQPATLGYKTFRSFFYRKE